LTEETIRQGARVISIDMVYDKLTPIVLALDWPYMGYSIVFALAVLNVWGHSTPQNLTSIETEVRKEMAGKEGQFNKAQFFKTVCALKSNNVVFSNGAAVTSPLSLNTAVLGDNDIEVIASGLWDPFYSRGVKGS
jgi:hypothetical protein